jgi:hypothetical protein
VICFLLTERQMTRIGAYFPLSHGVPELARGSLSRMEALRESLAHMDEELKQ